MNTPYQFGTEAISLQSNMFFDSLTTAIAKIREYSKPEDGLKEVDISGIVFAHTGMLIKMNLWDAPFINAAVMLPDVNTNHPFYSSLRRLLTRPSKTLKDMQEAGGSLVGTIDRENARVGGYFSKVEIDVYFTTGLLKAKKLMTDGEAAAILLHELGHLFTYYEYLNKLTRTTNIISALSRAMYEVEDQKERELIMKSAGEQLKVDSFDPAQYVSGSKEKRTLASTTFIISALPTSSRSDTGFSAYEHRSCEQVADQFAVKFGAGRDLASGLNKMLKMSYSQTPRSAFIILEIIDLLWLAFDAFRAGFTGAALGTMVGIGGAQTLGGLILAGVMFIPVVILLKLAITYLTFNSVKGKYDGGKERLILIKRTIVDSLKDRDLPPGVKEKLIADAELVDKLASDLYEDRLGIFEWIVMNTHPSRIRDRKNELVFKDIENLLTNDLFLRSAQFQ